MKFFEQEIFGAFTTHKSENICLQKNHFRKHLFSKYLCSKIFIFEKNSSSINILYKTVPAELS